MEGFVVLAEAL